jgi:AcrR family transcriptional regulator
VRSEVDRLGGTIAERIDVDADHETVGWWIASTWLANAILRTSGCPIPEPFADDVARLLALLGSARGERSKAASVVPGTLPMPSTSPRAAHDDTAEALVQAAAQIMATDGVHEADTRRIASEAGMTTGALYRRFRGRSELLADVLKSQLTPERYAWAEEFIQTLDHPDDLDAGARYLAALTARTWTEDQGAQLLLEITVAAHTDEELRTGIMQEITKVADAREEMLRQFIELGLVRTGLSASTLAWLLQVPPIGMRILASIGMIPNEAGLTRLMRAYLAFLMTDNDSSV